MFWWRSASSPPAPLGGKVSLTVSLLLSHQLWKLVHHGDLTGVFFPPAARVWAHTGWNNRVEYEPGTGALALFPNVHLETCDESVASVRVTVELETSHIGKGCDRDTYSEKSLHRLCGKEAREGPWTPRSLFRSVCVWCVCVSVHFKNHWFEASISLTCIENHQNRHSVSGVSFKWNETFM